MVELSILCPVSDKPICPGEGAQGPVSCGFILPSGRAQDHTYIKYPLNSFYLALELRVLYHVSYGLILPGCKAQGPVSWAP
jgi:hypothetical protein